MQTQLSVLPKGVEQNTKLHSNSDADSMADDGSNDITFSDAVMTLERQNAAPKAAANDLKIDVASPPDGQDTPELPSDDDKVAQTPQDEIQLDAKASLHERSSANTSEMMSGRVKNDTVVTTPVRDTQFGPIKTNPKTEKLASSSGVEASLKTNDGLVQADPIAKARTKPTNAPTAAEQVLSYQQINLPTDPQISAPSNQSNPQSLSNQFGEQLNAPLLKTPVMGSNSSDINPMSTNPKLGDQNWEELDVAQTQNTPAKPVNSGTIIAEISDKVALPDQRQIKQNNLIEQLAANRVYQPDTNGVKSSEIPAQQAPKFDLATLPIPPVNNALVLNAKSLTDGKKDSLEFRAEALSVSNQLTSGISAPAPTIRPEVAQPVMRQIVEVIHARVTTDRVIEVSLNPAELGRLRMSISPAEAGVTINIMAERAETIELARRNLDDLRQAFSEMGHENISFSFEQNSNFDEQESSGQKDQADWSENSLNSPTATNVQSNSISLLSGIDIRV